MIDLSLYLIMGSQDCPSKSPVQVLIEAIEGGITCFQFREKNSGRSWAEIIQLGRKLRHICREHQIPFIVNDRVDLGLLLDADGIHVGQQDFPAQEVRKLIGANRILGVSANTPQEAQEALQSGADYIGVGPIYATSSKPDADPPTGPAGITKIRQQFPSLPIVGIGGITPERAPAVIAAGANGVSVISAITKAPSSYQAAQAFIKQMTENATLHPISLNRGMRGDITK